VRPFQIAAAAADAHDDRPPETASAGASRQRIRRIDARPEGRTSQRLGAGAKVVGAWRVRRAQSAAAPTVTQSCHIAHVQCCRNSQ
jgi:hypothetical protein